MKGRMKACVLHGIGIENLRCETRDIPKIQEGQVLVKIYAAGICGSDADRVFTKGTYHYPTVIGHEFAGKVVSVNEEDAWWENKRVAVFPLIPCRKCGFCKDGNYAQCKDYNYYGSRCDGGFAEYLAVNKWNLIALPNTVTYEEAAMLEPAAVAVHALAQAGGLAGKIIVIYGAGTIGMIMAQIARNSGCRRVILIVRSRAKADFVEKMGFEAVVASDSRKIEAQIAEMTGGQMGVDIVIEGCGASAALENALKIAAPFGTVICMGNPSGDMRLQKEAYGAILRKQLLLKGTWNSSFGIHGNDWEKVLQLLEHKKLDLQSLITDRYRLQECVQAFEDIRSGKKMHIKSMFIMEERE